MKNLKRNWLAISKFTWGIWQILTQAPKSLNNSHFNGLLLTKVYNVWVKKVQRSYLSWHWRVMQNLKKNWHVAWKKTWGIWQIFIRALKVSKLGLWWDPSIQSRKYTTLKFTDELWRMMENLKRNRLVVSKLAWGIWLILTRALKNLKNLHFHGLLLTNVYKI